MPSQLNVDIEALQNLNMELSINSFAITHTGKVRTRNEDSILDLADQNLWVVADGMGGHDAGDFASQTIISHLSTFTKQSTLAKNIDLIEHKISAANQDIQEHAKLTKVDKTKTCGSTVVGLFTWNDLGIVFWSGDSRLYRYNTSLHRISEDHSYVEELVRLGQIAPEDAEAHPAANIILNAIGIKESIFLDLDYVTLNHNDVFILCSDGLYKDMCEQRLSDIIEHKTADMEYLATQLLEKSLDAGGTDNTSIICISIQNTENNNV